MVALTPLLSTASVPIGDAAGLAAAVLPTLPKSTQFDLTGFAQSATLDTACVAASTGQLDADGNPALCQLAVARLGGCLDPRKQAPMEVGDYVTYAGSLEQDGTGDYISAHTVIDDVAIFTFPGTNPAYLTVEVSLIGTGGLTIFGRGEAAIRTRIEGMTTDETRNINLYGIDINPFTVATTDRLWGSIGVDPGPPNGAVRGRWRFRPPCQTFGTPVTDKKCTFNQSGSFLPPTRELRAVVAGLESQDPQNAGNCPNLPCAISTANGIFYGQYHAPIGEYIFPENVPGSPIPENNFNTIDFLAYGGYTSFAGTRVGVLNPWPSNVIPTPLVAAVATINGGPYNVAFGGSTQLSGSVNTNATSPVKLQWTVGTTPGGTDLNAKLTNATTTNPTFNAAGLNSGTYFLSFTASNIAGPSTASTTIVVAPAPPPTVNPITNQTVVNGTPVSITATSSSAPLPTFAWTQTSGPAAVAFTQAPAAGTATSSSSITFTPLTAGTYTFSVQATNANGTSTAVSVTITVQNAVITNVTLTPVEYRISKQRLVITATTPDLNVTSMVLQPYVADTGTTFDPATLGAAQFTNTGGGIWTITVVGAPKPACNLNPNIFATPCAQKSIQVMAFTGAVNSGISPFTALDRIRQ
jgi:hypothetical protein